MTLFARVLGVAGVAVGVIILLAGLSKLIHGTAELARMTGHVLGVSEGASSRIGSLVILLEIALGVWIIAGIARPYSLGGALCMVGAFTLVLSLAAIRRSGGDCGCFGGRSGSAALGIVRNVALLGVMGGQWVLEVDAANSPSLGSMPFLDALLGVAWGCFAVVLFRTLAWMEGVRGRSPRAATLGRLGSVAERREGR